MDLHRLAEERSVAYHSAIAERLQEQPEILEMARRRVATWLKERSGAPFYAQKWAEVLAKDIASIAAFLIERSELADALRQSTPFAGALQPRERWEIWRETRDRFSHAGMDRSFQLLDSVALTVDLPQSNLHRGQVGTIVDLLDGGNALEVEFSDQSGRTYASLGVRPDQVMLLRDAPEPAT